MGRLSNHSSRPVMCKRNALIFRTREQRGGDIPQERHNRHARQNGHQAAPEDQRQTTGRTAIDRTPSSRGFVLENAGAKTVEPVSRRARRVAGA